VATVIISKRQFLEDRQGKTFADVANHSDRPFQAAIEFFNNENRQRRMEESELHHDRAPLAGVVRELEAQETIDKFLRGVHPRRSARFRQAIGVLVRMIMEQRGWRKTGRKGSLGVRAAGAAKVPAHNTGGLAFWFIRAERYERIDGNSFPSVRSRYQQIESKKPDKSGRRQGARPSRPDIANK